MSGGHYNYSYHRVNDMADELERSTDVVRRAFAAHLRLVAKAMHDVEWVDSCDYGPGDDHEAIHAVIEQEHIDRAARAMVKQYLDRLVGAARHPLTEEDET